MLRWRDEERWMPRTAPGRREEMARETPGAGCTTDTIRGVVHEVAGRAHDLGEVANDVVRTLEDVVETVGGLIGRVDHMFEAGLDGMALVIEDDSALGGGPVIGYRYQPATGGFFFRATIQLIIAPIHNSDELLVAGYPGLSFGYALRE